MTWIFLNDIYYILNFSQNIVLLQILFQRPGERSCRVTLQGAGWVRPLEHRPRRRGVKAGLRDIRASGLETTPVQYVKHMIILCIFVSRNLKFVGKIGRISGNRSLLGIFKNI